MPGVFDRPFETLARRLLSMGIQPNTISLLQLPTYGAILYTAIIGELWWCFGLCWIPMILDGLDGIMARIGGLTSRTGAILDASMDTLGLIVSLLVAWVLVPWSLPYASLALALNLVLYVQNHVTGVKLVSYYRGPLLLGAFLAPLMPLALALVTATPAILIVWRYSASAKSVRHQRHAP